VLGRAWHLATQAPSRSARRARGRRMEDEGASAPTGGSVPHTSGNHLDDADERRDALGGSWFLPRP
jgi:hypothetical protein